LIRTGESTTRIAVILPFFGKLPHYWNLTEESMRFNSSIDWIIYSDQDIDSGPNIHIKKLSLREFSTLVSERLGFPVLISRPYKICDFRPAFGEIFEPELKDYDFWGYCDADVIFGNLSPHIRAGIESGAEKIFQRGHLSLVRNSLELNRLYRVTPYTPTFSEVFANPKSLLYDEAGGFYTMLTMAGYRTFEDGKLFDIQPRRFQLKATNADVSRPIYILKDYRIHEFDRKSLAFKREGRYIHLQKRPYRVESSVTSLGALTGGLVGLFGPTSLEVASEQGLRPIHTRPWQNLGLYLTWVLWHIKRRVRKVRNTMGL
jgi:hypothetical protein